MEEKGYVLLAQASTMTSAHTKAILHGPELDFVDVRAPNPCP